MSYFKDRQATESDISNCTIRNGGQVDFLSETAR